MCKSNVRSASSFEKIDFDAIKAEESKEGVEIAESVVKETISDLRRKIKRSLSLQSISSDVATQSARNMVSQLVNLYVKK